MADDVSKRLRDARRDLGKRLDRDVTKKEVAALLGVHAVSYGDWENGKYKPPTDVFPALAEFFGVSPLWLAWGIPDIPHLGTANASEKPKP